MPKVGQYTQIKKKLSAPSQGPSKWLEYLRRQQPPRIGTHASYEWKHAAAEALHGWKKHLYNEGCEITITWKTYLRALAAATTAPGCPEKKALSRYK